MIKESIGIYLGPESAVLVHVAKTPSGIEILGTKQGELASLKEHIKPAYKANSATYSRQGSDQIFEVHQEIPAELSVVAVLGARSIFYRPITLPAESENVAQLVYLEAQQMIPFPLEGVAWGYDFFQPLPTGELSIRLLAVKNEVMQLFAEPYQRAELTLTRVLPSIESILHLGQRGGVLLWGEKSSDEKGLHSDIRLLAVGEHEYYTRDLPASDPADFLSKFQRSVGFWRSNKESAIESQIFKVCHSGIPQHILDILAKDERSLLPFSYHGFEGKTTQEYLALGAALADLNGSNINFLASPQPPAEPTPTPTTLEGALELITSIRASLNDSVRDVGSMVKQVELLARSVEQQSLAKKDR